MVSTLIPVRSSRRTERCWTFGETCGDSDLFERTCLPLRHPTGYGRVEAKQTRRVCHCALRLACADPGKEFSNECQYPDLIAGLHSISTFQRAERYLRCRYVLERYLIAAPKVSEVAWKAELSSSPLGMTDETDLLYISSTSATPAQNGCPRERSYFGLVRRGLLHCLGLGLVVHTKRSWAIVSPPS